MKKVMQQISLLLLGVVIISIGCRKDDIINRPGQGGDGQVSNAVRFSIDVLPGENNPITGLFAIVNVSNEQNQLVLADKKIGLSFNGKYVSDTIILPNGNYKVTKLLLVNETSARFATPVANSPKAAMVQRPLSISFALPKENVSQLSIEVARIGAGDQPENFGYPAGTFVNQGGNPPPTDPSPSVKIKIKPMIKIGDVIYDSIPVSFTWISWDETGKMLATSRIDLPAGTNEVSLPGSGYKYSLQVERWGITDEISLLKSDIQQGTVYSLGGNKAAKKLKSELIYKWVNGAFKSESKNAYEYNASGRLSQIIYYLRKADNTPYVSITDQFTYNASGKAESIKRYDSSNNLIIVNAFDYDTQGKVIRVSQTEGSMITSGQVTYSPSSDGHNINIKYTYTQSPYNMNYNMVIARGNKIQDGATTANNGSESGNYQYDFNINPYIHMNWPDIFLSHQSRNNLVAQQKQYSWPASVVIPYSFEYTYDAEGFPKEVIKSHFNYFSNVFMYKSKTVYNY